MFFAFHRGTIFNPLQDIIRFRTDSPFCHVEFVFSDGKAFSAELSGTQYVVAPDPTDPDWTLVDARISADDEATIRKWCDAHDGLPYDWWGVVGILFDELEQAEPNALHAYFCSAVSVAGSQQIGWWKFAPATAVWPGEVYMMLLSRLEVS